jgi:hypothetical protein
VKAKCDASFGMRDILSEIWKFAVIGKVRKKGHNYDLDIRV